MITRSFGGDYRAGCSGAPPPLHVVADNPEGNWYPVARPYFRPQPPGPVMIYAPVVAPFGDDPTDPSAQTIPRIPTTGMVARFNVGPSGVRQP